MIVHSVHSTCDHFWTCVPFGAHLLECQARPKLTLLECLCSHQLANGHEWTWTWGNEPGCPHHVCSAVSDMENPWVCLECKPGSMRLREATQLLKGGINLWDIQDNVEHEQIPRRGYSKLAGILLTGPIYNLQETSHFVHITHKLGSMETK